MNNIRGDGYGYPGTCSCADYDCFPDVRLHDALVEMHVREQDQCGFQNEMEHQCWKLQQC